MIEGGCKYVFTISTKWTFASPRLTFLKRFVLLWITFHFVSPIKETKSKQKSFKIVSVVLFRYTWLNTFLSMTTNIFT